MDSVVSVYSAVPAGDEHIFVHTDEPVGAEVLPIVEQHDVAWPKLASRGRLHVENFAITDGGIHAVSARLETKSKSVHQQGTRHLPKNFRVRFIFSHRS